MTNGVTCMVTAQVGPWSLATLNPWETSQKKLGRAVQQEPFGGEFKKHGKVRLKCKGYLPGVLRCSRADGLLFQEARNYTMSGL